MDEKKRKALQILGSRVRDARIAAGLTQEDLSVKTGVSQEYISRVEGGKKNPSYLILVALIQGMGISHEEFWKFNIPLLISE